MINRIKGRSNTATVKHLSVGNDIITDKTEIANTLAEQLAYNSSSNQCSDRFLKQPEVSDETGALLVYSCFITYKSFSHRPTSIEHAELCGM